MLSSFQKKVSAFAITCVAFLIILAFAVICLKILGYMLHTFSTVIWPLIAAVILGMIMQPVVDFISKKLRVGKTIACAITFVIFCAAIGAVLVLTLPTLIEETVQLAQSLPNLVQDAAHHLSDKFPETKETIQQKLGEIKSAVSSELSFGSGVETLKKVAVAAKSATGGIVALVAMLTAFAVTPIYLYYILTGNFDFINKLETNLPFLSRNMRDDIVFFVGKFNEILTSFFRGQLIIALIMGVLYGIGLSVIGVKFGFLLGMMAGLLNIVPYLGTIIGLGTIIPTAFFQTGGGLVLALIALGEFIVVQLLESYVLTPKIIGDRTGLHPAVIIFAIFFWGIAFNGIIGMVVAIPLTAFIVAFWMRMRDKLRMYTPPPAETANK